MQGLGSGLVDGGGAEFVLDGVLQSIVDSVVSLSDPFFNINLWLLLLNLKTLTDIAASHNGEGDH